MRQTNSLQFSRRRLLSTLAFAPLFSLATSGAAAQPYPARPVRLIIPFAEGGPNDISARIIAEALSASLEQTVFCENRPGAGGNIGAEAAAKAAPDGHTLFWAQAATHGINPSLYRKLGYDAVRDFVPIGMIGTEPLVLVTNPAFPARDVSGLIAAAKAAPGTFNYGSGGAGSTPHMAAELFALSAGLKLVHVPYRGNAPAIKDAIGGHLHLVFDGMNSAIGHIKAGSLKALAVTSRERTALLPEVPTLAETLPGYEVLSWGGIVAPAGTPADVVARLSRELIAIAKRPAVQQRFAALGVHLDVGTPEAMDQFVRAQIGRWRHVVAATGIRID
jgi:tripartite-type tricarboxylate transporter receptor subunit TctC